MHTLRKLELLAPAGSRTCLQAALDNGCDAIYFGVRGFNMRVAADNFTIDQLPEVATLCHARNVKAYLALNTIQYQNEVAEMQSVVSAAAAAEIDAVICWDHAVLAACKAVGIDAHLSTQASVSNSAAIRHYHDAYGIKRFVLARECSLEHVTQILADLKNELGPAADTVELEAFVHGAMCVSISGRCFMSEHSFGHSGNRGACIQPCRREFRIMDVEGEVEYEIGRDYVLSPKDLCTLPFLDRLIESGIHSFKIEGRNRNPEYVATVTAAYRQVIDHYQAHHADPDLAKTFKACVDALMPRLKSVYNRGFSDGFYMGRPINEWVRTSGSEATMTKAFCGPVVNYYSKMGVAEIKIQSAEFSLNDELLIQGPTTGSVKQIANSIQVDHAPVELAPKGARVAIQVDSRVRVNDKVYVRRPTT